MKNLEKDEMIKKLADFVGVDLSTLKILDKTEEKAISLAHEIAGDSYDDIEHFFEQIRMPEFIDPEFVFKALKYNSTFYNQNISLIRNSEDSRQKVYEKAREKAKSNNRMNIMEKFQEIRDDIAARFKECIANNLVSGSFALKPIPVEVRQILPSRRPLGATGNCMTIPYCKELSNDPIQPDLEKSYMEIFDDGIRFKFVADFDKDKRYIVFLGKDKVVLFKEIIGKEAVIKTETPDDYLFVLIHSEKK